MSKDMAGQHCDSGEKGTSDTDVYLPSYRLGKTLGVGSFGKVKVAVHIPTGYKVAVKVLNRKKIKAMDMEEKVRREIRILQLFTHPHIVRLYEVVESPGDIFVVTEYVRKGELFDYIVEKGRLDENEARLFFQQIMGGVEYCHRNMVVHRYARCWHTFARPCPLRRSNANWNENWRSRDLKPENLLLDSSNNVKIADFGLSNTMADGHFLKTSCGSPNYAAPEVISGKQYAGPEVDVWSCGVILYALLCGSLPFDDESIPNLFKKIKNGSFALPSYLSSGARDLVSKLLLVDPLKRLSIPEIRQHHWFATKLPRYLALPTPDVVSQRKAVDIDALEATAALGYPREKVLQELKQEQASAATVAYLLILDNRKRVASGYLGANFDEQAEAALMQPVETTELPHIQLTSRRNSSTASIMHQRHISSRWWGIGTKLRFSHHSEAMNEVYRALAANHFIWKKLSPYTLKCWCVRPPPYFPPASLPLSSSGSGNSA